MACNLNLWLNSQNIKICLFKYPKASQLWARMHTLLAKQGSFCFLFIVLSIWISIQKTQLVASLFFDMYTLSQLVRTARQVFLLLCPNPAGFRGEAMNSHGQTKTQLWIYEWLRSSRMPEEWKHHLRAQPHWPRTRRHNSWTHKYWQVCSRPPAQWIAAVPWHSSSLQILAFLRGKNLSPGTVPTATYHSSGQAINETTWHGTKCRTPMELISVSLWTVLSCPKFLV